MKIIIALLLLLFSVLVNAQAPISKSDSLHRILQTALNDTIRMDLFRQLGFYYQDKNSDSAQLYLTQSISLAQKLDLKLYAAGIMSGMIYMLSWNNYPKSLDWSLQALKIAEDPASEKNTWNRTAGQTPHMERLAVLGYIYYSMAQLYANTGNIEKQKFCLLKAAGLAESIQDSSSNMIAHLNLGNIFLQKRQLDSALFFAEKASALFSKSGMGDKDVLGWVYGLLGAIYQEKQDYDSSRNAYLTGFQLMQSLNDLAGMGSLSLSLSNLYRVINKPDSSLFFANKALEIYKAFKDLSGISNAYVSLSSTYDKQHQPDSAFTYLKSGTTIRDSLKNVERENLISYQNANFDEQMRLKNLEEEETKTKTKIKIYAMLAGISVCIVIASLLFRNNRNRKKANEVLEKQKAEIAAQKDSLEQTLQELKSTQAQLIQSEKMASLGELTAGIAHEIQNPLNFVNNFSDVNKELLEELKEELSRGNLDGIAAIANDLFDNEGKINHHGKRADSIVKGMLQHSRQTKGVKEPTDINALCEEYLKLSYHGLRAKDKSFNADCRTDFDEQIGKKNLVPQDIGRGLLNIINNAFYAVNHKQKLGSENYKPVVSIQTKKLGDQIEIRIEDNGDGIPEHIINKIFQPFFTTKPTGQGTGLGLSLTYDIITKEHNGTLQVESQSGSGTVFIIHLP